MNSFEIGKRYDVSMRDGERYAGVCAAYTSTLVILMDAHVMSEGRWFELPNPIRAICQQEIDSVSLAPLADKKSGLILDVSDIAGLLSDCDGLADEMRGRLLSALDGINAADSQKGLPACAIRVSVNRLLKTVDGLIGDLAQLI